MRMAEQGDRTGLSRSLAARQTAGNLSNSEAASLGKVVAEQLLRSATPAEALAYVRDVRPCARELDGALQARMSAHDAAGALAALARLEAGVLDVEDVRGLLTDADPDWRALGTRSLVRQADRAARQRALLDASPAVRRQAARACRDAADPRDLDALAEAARVDPEPMVRTEAIRTIATLPVAPGSDVAVKLRDLWTGGDEGLREDIARAWAATPIWGAGGRDALRVVLAAGRGSAVVEGAAAVLRRKDADAEVTSLATGVMSRDIEGASRRTRLQAIAEAPLDADHGSFRPVLRKAAADDDLDVRVSALSRLAEAREGGAAEQLEALAQPGASVAARARFALAEAGDRRIQLWLEQDLSAEAPETRLAAGTALAALGVAARAAPLLADADVSVRLRAACTLVGAARVGR
jgi:HEAT repeat protein